MGGNNNFPGAHTKLNWEFNYAVVVGELKNDALWEFVPFYS